MGSGGSWWLTDGSGGESWNTANNWSYAGSGDYTRSVQGGTMAGDVTEDGGESSSEAGAIDSVVVNGNWVDTGDGGGTWQGSEDSSYGGSGDYTISSPQAVHGDMSESGSSAWSGQYDWDEELGTDGQWYYTSGSGGDSTAESDVFAYSGSGTYSSGPISGAAGESGQDGSSYNFSTTSIIGQDGDWVTAGSGSESSSGFADSSYSGSGTYSRNRLQPDRERRRCGER